LASTQSSSLSPHHLFLDVSTELLECGHSVRFKAPGRSMQPIIKEGETITVEPIAPEAVKRGDIILYRTPGGMVAHRVVGIKREMTAQSSSLSPHHLFLLRGDAATTCDAPVEPDQVLGKVISVERDGRSINPYCLRVKTLRLARLIASRTKRWLLRLAEGQRQKAVIQRDGTTYEVNCIEQRILACASGLDPDPAQKRRLWSLMSNGVDVDCLIKASVKEGMAGLLYRNLMKAGIIESLNPQQKQTLESLYYQTVQFNLKRIYDMRKILEQLNERQIHVVLLKGMALLHQLYDDVGMRPLTDIDLWVLPHDYSALTSILSSQGYQRDPLYPNTFRKGATILDLNTHPLGADRIKTRAFLIARDQEHIYRAAQTTRIDGHKALCLNPYDQFLLLGLHLLKHSASRLIWLVDIKCLVCGWGNSDWDALIGRAQELGLTRTVSYICFLMACVLNYELPSRARQLLEAERLSLVEKRVLGRRVRGDSLPVWAPLVLSSSVKGFWKRLHFAVETLFPRPQILRQVFPNSPDCSVPRLYVKRIIQLSGMVKLP
jgi:hypothetical protein